MSDFFGSLNPGNVRFTDARINGDGPLPTNLSGPEGINDDPDSQVSKFKFNWPVNRFCHLSNSK